MGEKKRMEEEKKRLRVKRRRPAVARNTFLRRGKSPTTTSQNPHLLASPSTWQVVGIFLNTESFFFSLSSGSYARQEWKATLTVCVPLQNQTQMFFWHKKVRKFLSFQVGLVVLTFLICWLPFFVLALVIPLVGRVPGAVQITLHLQLGCSLHNSLVCTKCKLKTQKCGRQDRMLREGLFMIFDGYKLCWWWRWITTLSGDIFICNDKSSSVVRTTSPIVMESQSWWSTSGFSIIITFIFRLVVNIYALVGLRQLYA